MNFSRDYAEKFLRQAVGQGVWPGAVLRWGSLEGEAETLVCGQRGLTRNQEPVRADLSYDLASLTKVLASTSLALLLAAEGSLDLELPLREGPLKSALPSSFHPRCAPWHLLAHQSGLAPWRPFYRLQAEAGRQARREAIFSALRLEEFQPGQATVYSDLNFILLGFLLEEIAGEALDTLFERRLAKPLNLKRTGYRPSWPQLAPTEDGFRWGGPLGHPEAAILGPVPLGRVHDDNAAFLHGVAGHAGLFGSADEIWRLMAQWAKALSGQKSLFSRSSLENFLQVRPTASDSGRPLGFNICSQQSSLASTWIPPQAVGHLGYTGSSLWWETQSGSAVLLLSNRVHPKASNPAWFPGYYQGLGRPED